MWVGGRIILTLQGKRFGGWCAFQNLTLPSLPIKPLSTLVTLKGFAAVGCRVLFHSSLSPTARRVCLQLSSLKMQFVFQGPFTIALNIKDLLPSPSVCFPPCLLSTESQGTTTMFCNMSALHWQAHLPTSTLRFGQQPTLIQNIAIDFCLCILFNG